MFSRFSSYGASTSSGTDTSNSVRFKTVAALNSSRLSAAMSPGQRLNVVPPWLRNNTLVNVSSPSPMEVAISTSTLPRFRRPLAKQRSDTSSVSLFDMDDYPQLAQIRLMIIALCFFSFLVAPCVYMPLGRIQATYEQRCFLYTKLSVSRPSEGPNYTTNSSLAFDPVSTEWSGVAICHFTTYTAVNDAILSIMIGWSTVQIWPEMLSYGQGGLLALIFTLFSLALFIVNVIASHYIRKGFNKTCSSLVDKESFYGVTCSGFDGKVVEMIMAGIIINLDTTSLFVEVASWCLAGVWAAQVLLSAYALGVIWFYHYYSSPEVVYLESTSLSQMINDELATARRMRMGHVWNLKMNSM